MTWRIEFTAEVPKQVASITPADRKALMVWVDEVLENGLEATQASPSWHDHELHGAWEGHRAIAFGKACRAIYRVESGKLIIVVVRVTGTHNYKR